jgi:hypothetical protein
MPENTSTRQDTPTIELRITRDAGGFAVDAELVRRDTEGVVVLEISPLSPSTVLTARLESRVKWRLELASNPVSFYRVPRPTGSRPGHVEVAVYTYINTLILVDVPEEEAVVTP